ncbi:hypothetical protein [Absidia glauca]|uniref:Kinesin-like protein n=1 Tax=Absidia glauca TaxID=4829 RepID=A0A163JC83_ABSGL|nr:hypothetical protein [Absidia glauca]
MPGSRIPVSNHHQQQQLASLTSSFLQSMADKQPPVSPPSTPLLYSPAPLTPSPSSSYPLIASKSLRPRQTKSTTIARENIQVMVRCRPPSETELRNHEEDCWLLTPEQGSVKLNDPDGIVFEYDKVFKGTNNGDIYQAGIQKLVRSTMDGYNGTVFAYGQTASGKTYTMVIQNQDTYTWNRLTRSHVHLFIVDLAYFCCTSEEPGVIPKAVQDVFAYIEEEAIDREFLLQVSYMEIYNEKINDLLSAKHSPTGLLIRTANGQDYVENLTAIAVTTPEEVMAFIKLGEERRHTGETDFNENSSRSHTIFQLIIESKSRVSSLASVRTSRLNLIDLAGSEKVATNTERRQEGAFINKSLLTLGKVITHLNAGAKHIPYRDSKLTRILSASLSGNDRVSVICTINPAWKSKDESTNTLRFAQGVKKVEINPKITQVAQHSRLQNYKEQIVDLENQMMKKTKQEAETKEKLSHLLGLILTSSKMMPTATHQDEINQKEEDLKQLDDRLSQSQQNLEEKTVVIDELQRAVQDYQRMNDQLQTQLNKYSDSFAEVSKRWNALEASINRYKDRVFASERRVAILEAQQQADDYSKRLMGQQLEECQARLDQKIQDDFLLAGIESLYEEPIDDENSKDDESIKDGGGGGGDETRTALFLRFLYLNEGSWLLLFAFAVWLFL